ncbi:nuclear transport factor 2 family protein [Pandoraea pneumonica]|jgi:ketosteroid isomerase-like protein|uniref:Nuclear transport factor 2 family protein n=1 Tax=Pandoraea pneumonica TaxID=2508299 RepID=A0A5E4V159_9BURK|nr:nuclear transport factor 2 family protein [Pandoraea pneumonica]VVE05861.1 nuclear transport factor 2 family protein [Pandoraea pneumonica]
MTFPDMTHTLDQNTLDAMLAKQACQDLVMRFAACNDRRDPQGLAALFAENGVLVRPGAAPLVGPAAIAAAYADRPAERMTRHLMGNVLIDVTSPTGAIGSSTVLLWSGSTQASPGPFGRPAQGRQVMGEFEDTFVKTAQGWRIARREARFTFVREA